MNKFAEVVPLFKQLSSNFEKARKHNEIKRIPEFYEKIIEIEKILSRENEPKTITRGYSTQSSRVKAAGFKNKNKNKNGSPIITEKQIKIPKKQVFTQGRRYEQTMNTLVSNPVSNPVSKQKSPVNRYKKMVKTIVSTPNTPVSPDKVAQNVPNLKNNNNNKVGQNLKNNNNNIFGQNLNSKSKLPNNLPPAQNIESNKEAVKLNYGNVNDIATYGEIRPELKNRANAEIKKPKEQKNPNINQLLAEEHIKRTKINMTQKKLINNFFGISARQ